MVGLARVLAIACKGIATPKFGPAPADAIAKGEARIILEIIEATQGASDPTSTRPASGGSAPSACATSTRRTATSGHGARAGSAGVAVSIPAIPASLAVAAG